MHEAISAAVHAERDAYFALKLAEQNAALQAQLAAKIAELEGALPRLPIRPAGPNDGAAADSVGQSTPTANLLLSASKLQTEIGRLAAEISLQFIGDPVNSKDEVKLNSLSTEPSPALISSVRDLFMSTTPQTKETSARAIFEHAAQSHGQPIGFFGAGPFADTIASNFAVGGAVPNRRDAGGSEVASRELSIANLTAHRTIDEANAAQASMRIQLLRGTAGIESVYDPVSDRRVYSISHRTEHLLKTRSHFQQLMIKAAMIVLDSFITQRINPSFTQEYSTILTDAKEADTKKLFLPELFGNPTAISSLLTLVTPNLHVGSNVLARVLFTHRDRFRVMDVSLLGGVLSQVVLLPNEDPSSCFVRLQELRRSLPEPNPEIAFGNLGLPVQPESHGEPSRFQILTDQSLVTFIMAQFDRRIALNSSLHPARNWLTPEVMKTVKDGEFALAAFQSLMTALATENIPTTVAAESLSPDSAYGAVGGGWTQGKGGSKGGAGSGSKPGGAGSSSSGITKARVTVHGSSGGAGGGGGGGAGGGGGGAGGGGAGSAGGGNKSSGGSGGGAAADASRGRSQGKTSPAPRPQSLVPGDSTGVICYARFVALLGPKMENLVACVGLINKYFKDTVKHEAFISDNGVVRVPLALCPNFAWKAMSSKFLNHNVRRDIYAAWNVLRDRCRGKGKGLTAYGQEYKEKNPTWENLSSDEFASLYTPASTKPKFTLGKFVIRGVTVTEFSA
jgi:hypothetical protein